MGHPDLYSTKHGACWLVDGYSMLRKLVSMSYQWRAELCVCVCVCVCHLQWKISYRSKLKRVAVLVSKLDHCLYDLLIRHRSGTSHSSLILQYTCEAVHTGDTVRSDTVPFPIMHAYVYAHRM